MVEVLENKDGEWKPATPQEPHGIIWEWLQGVDEETQKLLTMPMALAGTTGLKYEGQRHEGEYADSPGLSSIGEAIRALSCPVRFWFNPKQLQLVIEDETGKRVAIGTVQLGIPFQGPHWERWDTIARGIKAKLEAS